MSGRLGPKAQHAYSMLHESITTGRFPVGSQLPSQARLAEEYGVALLTLREALRRLEDAGLVETVHGKGTFVRSGRTRVVGDSEEFSRSLIQASPIAIMCLDAAGTVRTWNRACEETFGWRAGEVLGKRPPQLGAGRWEPFFRFVVDSMQGESVADMHDTAVRRDGSSIDVTMWFAPYYDRDGYVTGVMVTIADISARIQAEAALRLEQQRFRTVYEDAPVGIALVDSSGRVMQANRTLQQFLDYSGEELIGLHFREITHPDDLDADLALAGELFAGSRERYIIDKRYLRQDGATVWGRLFASLVRDTTGHPEFAIAMLQDLSGQRQMENKLGAVFQYAAIGINLGAIGGNILTANPAFCQMMEYTEAELRGKTFAEITMAEDVKIETVLYNELLAGERDCYSLEKRYIRRSGEPLWVRITVSLVRDAAGRPEFDIAMVEDMSERKRAEELAAHQAVHDVLTGLPNRLLLLDRLEQGILSARRDLTPLTLLLMDLDRFKEVNDTFGHAVGDLLLQEVARRARMCLRDTDTVARLGGDELAIVLPATDERGALRTADKLLDCLGTEIRVENRRLTISGSIGIAVYPQHGEDGAALLRKADVAMYVAKRTRASKAVYDPEQDQYTPGRLELIADLRHAVANDGLMLHYQPQVDPGTGRTEHVEALVRWNHPVRGMIPPGQFIPLAEHSGLIGAITLWVLRQALTQARRWLEAGREIGVSVNLSAHSLQDPALPQAIAGQLADTGLAPHALRVEVTESAIMGDPDAAIAVLSRLREMNIEISIDDFGTGYSSLAYLKRMPVQEVKVDRSFVVDIVENLEDAAIVRSVIDLGHSLGLRVVAEGVETAEALGLLQGLGCDMVQGYYLSPPILAEQVIDWVTAHEDSHPSLPQRRPEILVVDDNPVYLQILQVLLRHDGYTVTTASSIAEAVEVLQHSQPDLALVDICLPDGNGLDLARRIVEEAGDATRVVAMTALGRPLDQEQALRIGCVAYLVKPTNHNDMVQVVRRHLGLPRRLHTG